MQKFHIYQKTGRFNDSPKKLVGTVQAEDLDAAYFASQNYKAGPWNKENPCRSVSEGDIIQDAETGEMFLVEGIGFEKVESFI